MKVGHIETYALVFGTADGSQCLNTAYFYGLDTIPLFLATAIYIFFWPGQMIEDTNSQEYPLDSITDGND